MHNRIFPEDHYLILDGAMGTMLQKSGLQLGERPDLLSITHPDIVEKISRMYVDSGCDLICANTFGSNAKKLAGCGYTVEEVIDASLQIAKRACAGTNARVMLDVGPIGELLEPNGTLTFEEAYDIYKQVVVAGEKSGADLIKFATMTDLYEVKAGVLAARENTSLPILVSMTFEENGRTFTGCCIESMAATLEGLGVDGIGINCSLGPKEIFPLAQKLCANTSLPVFIKPNAGLPDPQSGHYAITPHEFCRQMEAYMPLGISAVGGCCGTTPETIRMLAQSFRAKRPVARNFTRKSVVCTPTRHVVIDRVTVIGERINPTGKMRFKQALCDHDIDYILAQGIAQAAAGADILDVNVGLPEIDEKDMMVKTLKALQGVCDLPLQLDSTRPDVLEAGLRVYNGKPIVNSVNAERAVLDKVLPMCKKYGAAVVGLTLDENGIPSSAQARFALAEKIVNAALQAGLPREDIYIDCLTLTASAQQADVMQTLHAVRMVKEKLGVKTVLGVSNISFGLPCREQINTAFLTMAMTYGLDMPILNPNTESMMAAVASFAVLNNTDKDSTAYIAHYAGQAAAPPVQTGQQVSLHDAVLQGLKAPAVQAVRHALCSEPPEQLVNRVLIPALDEVGEKFEKGIYFLPQLLQAASAAQAAFDVIKEAIAKQGSAGASTAKGKIIVATVKGDIHDIGKNIVKVILENYGYEIVDLGRDVAVQDIVDAARKQKARLVGLSALMTTTLVSMEETITALRAAQLPCKVMVGGAVLTPSYAKQIGADYYAKDAKQAVDIAKEVLG